MKGKFFGEKGYFHIKEASWVIGHRKESDKSKGLKDVDHISLRTGLEGTNWLIEILCLIQSRGDTNWVRSVPIWDRSPWIELEAGLALANKMEGPRLLTSHLPIHLFPKSFFSSKAKVIYLMRNPKDMIVSRYFFWNAINWFNKPYSLEQCLEWSMEGKVPYGSWFDHIHGWVSMRERENFLMLSYEELKRGTKRTVEKICQFLGKKVEPEELDLILENSSFEVMKENKMSNYSMLGDTYLVHKNPLIRKGITGDWKNHFTVAQAEAFDKLFQEKMADLPRELFPWE
ncbi:sulfotransferase 2A1-like isoform X2 [Nycticebus coucang]|uniref:sulfotransferase 2A1-like isoform X2 n=1 Tax=Nycticebus coucang TaxID=9470 RepID=UPI00234C592D|nr:sulfotransferase 2A1-like isoform X2 [Nycticebus coucang]